MILIRHKQKRAFTLVELMVTIMIASIVLLGIGVVMVDSIRGYNRMYDRVHEGIAQDAYVARITFDRAVRKASIKTYSLGLTSVEVYYYASPYSTALDRYSRFYESAGQLFVEYGNYDSVSKDTSPVNTTLLADNVENVIFDVQGARLSMVLSLNDGTRKMTIMTSAVRHNE